MRIAWVDIAKGIGILLVVAGHSSITGLFDHTIEKWIVSYHMALFFFIAGYCFNAARYPHFLGRDGYLMRKATSLAYPYVTLSILMALLSIVLYYGNDPTLSFKSQILELVHGDSRISPFWFIRILLVVELLYWLVARADKQYVIFSVGILLVLSVYLLPNIGSGRLIGMFPPRKIVNGLLFYLLGSISKPLLNRDISGAKSAMLAVAFFVAHLLLLAWDWQNVDFFAIRGTGDHLIRIVISLMGILGVIYASKFIDSSIPKFNQAMAWLGANSIILLAIHGHCGLFRHSWTGLPGWQSSLINLCVISVLMWSLSTVCSFMVKMPRFDFKKGSSR